MGKRTKRVSSKAGGGECTCYSGECDHCIEKREREEEEEERKRRELSSEMKKKKKRGSY